MSFWMGNDLALSIIICGVLVYVLLSVVNAWFFTLSKKWSRTFQTRFFTFLLIVSIGRTILIALAGTIERNHSSWCDENPVCRISLYGWSVFLDACLYSCVVILILYWIESWQEMNKRVGSVANAPRPPLASRTHNDMNRYHKKLYILVGVLSVVLYASCWLGYALFGKSGPLIVYTISQIVILLPLIIISCVWLLRHGRRLKRFLNEAQKVQELSVETGEQVAWVPAATRKLLKRINSMALVMTYSLFLRFLGIILFYVVLRAEYEVEILCYILVYVFFEAIPCCVVAVLCRPGRRIAFTQGSSIGIDKRLLLPTSQH